MCCRVLLCVYNTHMFPRMYVHTSHMCEHTCVIPSCVVECCFVSQSARAYVPRRMHMLQRVAFYCSVLERKCCGSFICCSVVQSVAASASVYAATHMCFEVRCSQLEHMCCSSFTRSSVLQRVAVCCSVLQSDRAVDWAISRGSYNVPHLCQ